MTPEQFLDAVFALPAPEFAVYLYSLGFAMVFLPWLVAYSGGRLIEALKT